eukprot:3941365-Rhodomonas_salina.4
MVSRLFIRVPSPKAKLEFVLSHSPAPISSHKPSSLDPSSCSSCSDVCLALQRPELPVMLGHDVALIQTRTRMILVWVSYDASKAAVIPFTCHAPRSQTQESGMRQATLTRECG